ncbi:MAG TPA: tetratricopeptide repeat protein [Terriglobales bacterium]|nr:tetratricopeptide repeat protein [Terriglobales bacterium]
MRSRLISRIFGLCFFLAFLLPQTSPATPSAEPRIFQDASAAPQSTKPVAIDPRAEFIAGQAALQSGDLAAAEAAFRHVLAANPRAGGAYANLGVIAMRRKQWDHAIKLLQKASQLEPKVSGIRLNLGLVYYRQGEYAVAIPWFSDVLRAQPDSEQARYLLGLCNLFIEHYADAVTALQPLWPQKSDDFTYLYVLDIAAHNAGQSDLDQKALARLVEVGGDTPQFHLLLGKAELSHQENDKAIVDLERAAAGNPDLPFLHLNLGVAYMRSGDSQRAEAEFRREIALDPDLPDTYELLGEFFVRDNNEPEAEKYFREALTRSSKMPGSLFGLAKIYLHQGNYQQALASVDSAEKLVPDNQSYHFVRGQILQRLGRHSEAQAEFTTSQKLLNAGINKEREKYGEPVPNPELKQPPQ